MPELPDIAVYIERLRAKVQGRVLRRVRVLNPFVLRTALPPIGSAEGRTVAGVERLGKRIVLALGAAPGTAGGAAPDPAPGGAPADTLYLVLHLMIAGRLRWLPPGAKPPGRISLVVHDFEHGALVMTEAGSKRRASLHLLPDRAALAATDPGGIDVASATPAEFAARLRSENHTLKRALTMPQLYSGIGNAYSDEILHRARLSPLALTRALDDGEVARLHAACIDTLREWTERLQAEAGEWPEKVTAFHPAMAVHGRHGQPCPVCGTPVQRIVYADNEANYCARCQTGGRLLADRALSRLLKASWPKSVDDLDS